MRRRLHSSALSLCEGAGWTHTRLPNRWRNPVPVKVYRRVIWAS